MIYIYISYIPFNLKNKDSNFPSNQHLSITFPPKRLANSRHDWQGGSDPISGTRSSGSQRLAPGTTRGQGQVANIYGTPRRTPWGIGTQFTSRKVHISLNIR